VIMNFKPPHVQAALNTAQRGRLPTPPGGGGVASPQVPPHHRIALALRCSLVAITGPTHETPPIH